MSSIGPENFRQDDYRITALDDNLSEASEDNWATILAKNVKIVMMAKCNVKKCDVCPSCHVPIQNFTVGDPNYWSAFVAR